MADINLTQVIHNVKEAYVDLTGDTDDITYGNISTKISEIQTGGNGGYSGVAIVPIQSIAKALPTNTLCGLAQNTAPTPYEQGGVWYNKVWLDTSVSPNVWKKYDIDTQTWETV